MRYVRIAMALVLLVGLVSLTGGCAQKKVSVTTGEIVLCTEGEIVSDTTEQIEVPANEVGDHAVKTSVVTCDLHSKIAALYQRAQDALAEDDVEAAERALAEVIALDPLYRRASSQIEDIKAGRTPAPDSGAVAGADGAATPGNDPKPGDESPTGPVLNLVSYTPDSLPGFVGQGLVTDVFVLTRTYVSTDRAYSGLVIVVEQFKNAEGAEEALARMVETTYPGDKSEITVEGKSGMFGTGQSVALAAFTDGALLVALEVSPTSGDPAAAKSKVVELAGSVAR